MGNSIVRDMEKIFADIILFLHTLFVLFVVGGQVLIMAGLLRGWHWVRVYWFRLLHLCAIAYVVMESIAGVMCPLTVWENALRSDVEQEGYGRSFIRHWVHELLFYEAPPWVFTLIYSLFLILVVATWIYGKPRRKGKAR